MIDWILVGTWLAFAIIAIYRLHKRRGGASTIIPVVSGQHAPLLTVSVDRGMELVSIDRLLCCLSAGLRDSLSDHLDIQATTR